MEQKAMISFRFVFFLSAIFIFTADHQAGVVAQTCSYDNGKYIANSAYDANLNHLLYSLYSNTEIDYGFYNSSYGQDPDKVYAIALCRGDVNPGICRACLNDARSLFKQGCPYQKEAIQWPGECMLRYSNRSIFGVVETDPVLEMPNEISVCDKYVVQFNDDVRSLLERLKGQAVAGGSLRKFAVGNATAPNSQTLYGLVQCTPDLSELDCNNCIFWAIQRLPQKSGGREGGRVIDPALRASPAMVASLTTQKVQLTTLTTVFSLHTPTRPSILQVISFKILFLIFLLYFFPTLNQRET
jgi:hypothetical protein